MTAAGADRDPVLQAAVERARAGIARLLEGRLLPGMDATHIAGQIVERLHADNWRPIPRPAPITAQGRKDPATAKAGAELARELMAERHTHPKETDHA